MIEFYSAFEFDDFPPEVHEVPDEDDLLCGPSEEDLAEFELAA